MLSWEGAVVEKAPCFASYKACLHQLEKKRERSSIGIFRLGIPTTAHRARRSGL